MGTITGVAADPTPFIMMAYSLGAMALLGFAHWSIWQRLKLRTQLAVVKSA